jgi:putative acetyltransferase
MHTTSTARGQGVGRLLVQYVIRLAGEQHITWLGLETGTQAEFEPARTLYQSFGFRACTPFGAYTVNPHSTCMALDLPAEPPQRSVSTGS